MIIVSSVRNNSVSSAVSAFFFSLIFLRTVVSASKTVRKKPLARNYYSN